MAIQKCGPYRSLMREGFMIHPLSHETVVNPPDWHIEIFKFQFKVSLENHKNITYKLLFFAWERKIYIIKNRFSFISIHSNQSM